MPSPRLEDPDLVTGRSRFLADLPLPPGCLHAAFVRSSIAHGRLRGVDAGAAAEHPGVHAVHTAASLELGPVVLAPALADWSRPPLADGVVRQVGEPVALILAETESDAADAVDLVDVEIEARSPVLVPGSTPLYPGAPPTIGEIPAQGEDPLDGAAHRFALSITNQRVASAPLECDGILVVPDGDRLDIWCTSQGAQEARNQLAGALGVDRAMLRVRSPAVGGGFGGRATILPEFAAVARAANIHGRPIRWIQSRYENLTGMAQGRGYVTEIALGLDDDLGLVGLDADITADGGSWGHMSALLLPSAQRQVPGLYPWPRYRFTARAGLTTTAPVGAYRGAGQPEANHARERLLDLAARSLERDPIELRRSLLISTDRFPFESVGGFTYDAGDPVAAFDTAVERADVSGWRRRQSARRESGSTFELGVGLANYAQTSGRGGPADAVAVQVRSDGRVLVACASPDHGQGHRTTWAALVADRLAIAPELVDVVDADTAALSDGQSTGGSRSTQVAASALLNACQDVVDDARHRAADLLEAAAADLVVVPAGHGEEAGLAVAGVPTRRVTWAELAAEHPSGCLDAARHEAVADASYPYGTHVSVVEVDTETGAIRLLAHTAVDDCGVVLQPMLVEGQQHGGAVAGIAQALFESVDHDAAGNPLSATFATYLLPAASELCPIETATVGVPATGNQLGTRGIGENGCNGATAAVHNAVIDALWPRGVTHVELPLTPERIWQALRSGDARS